MTALALPEGRLSILVCWRWGILLLARTQAFLHQCLSLAILTWGNPCQLVMCHDIHTWILGGLVEEWLIPAVQLFWTREMLPDVNHSVTTWYMVVISRTLISLHFYSRSVPLLHMSMQFPGMYLQVTTCTTFSHVSTASTNHWSEKAWVQGYTFVRNWKPHSTNYRGRPEQAPHWRDVYVHMYIRVCIMHAIIHSSTNGESLLGHEWIKKIMARERERERESSHSANLRAHSWTIYLFWWLQQRWRPVRPLIG